jgi:muramidase (phage lysozyme)
MLLTIAHHPDSCLSTAADRYILLKPASYSKHYNSRHGRQKSAILMLLTIAHHPDSHLSTAADRYILLKPVSYSKHYNRRH